MFVVVGCSVGVVVVGCVFCLLLFKGVCRCDCAFIVAVCLVSIAQCAVVGGGATWSIVGVSGGWCLVRCSATTFWAVVGIYGYDACLLHRLL